MLPFIKDSNLKALGAPQPYKRNFFSIRVKNSNTPSYFRESTNVYYNESIPTVKNTIVPLVLSLSS